MEGRETACVDGDGEGEGAWDRETALAWEGIGMRVDFNGSPLPATAGESAPRSECSGTPDDD